MWLAFILSTALSGSTDHTVLAGGEPAQAANTPPAADTVSAGKKAGRRITVTGHGPTREAARLDALRLALEQGGALEISSRSKVEDFQLIRDTIYARADGIVTEYTTLERGTQADGTHYWRISARVSPDAVATTWGQVQHVLEQVGRPGVAVFIDEWIDGELQDQSMLASRIQRRLLDAGFSVYVPDAVPIRTGRPLTRLQELAGDHGGQIFIAGTAHAAAAGSKNLAGQPTAMYNCDAAVKMYYTDTAQLIASESLPSLRGGARGRYEHSPQAARTALANAGEALVEKCYRSAMKRWSTYISAGGEIVLEVQGVTVLEALRLTKMLRHLDTDRIRHVNPSIGRATARFRIQTKMTAETLAELLVTGEFAKLIELVDLKSHRIRAKKVGPW
ncbi:MAG: hypothetical protein ACE5EX_06430 [Phycisphaerae bacterium]